MFVNSSSRSTVLRKGERYKILIQRMWKLAGLKKQYISSSCGYTYGPVICKRSNNRAGHGLSPSLLYSRRDLCIVTTLENIIPPFLFIIAHRPSRSFPFEPRRRQAKLGTRAGCLSTAHSPELVTVARLLKLKVAVRSVPKT